MKMKYKNEWGRYGSNLDPQRADLFKITIDLPEGVGTAGTFDSDIQFAVYRFPFPETKQEVIPIKFLNQTNHILGAETATAPITIPVRYAFNAATARLLYRWKYLNSNPRTGGTAQTTAVKSTGHFYWLTPNMAVQRNVEDTSSNSDVLKEGLVYVLDGCLITGLRPSDADMKATGDSALVDLTFELTVDRYYPDDIRTMQYGVLNNGR